MEPTNLTNWKKGDKFSAGHLQEGVDLLRACGPLDVSGGIDSITTPNGRGISSRKAPRFLRVVRMKITSITPTSSTPGVVEAQSYTAGYVTTDVIYGVKAAGSHAVGDEILVACPIGNATATSGSETLYKGNPVYYQEINTQPKPQWVKLSSPSGSYGSNTTPAAASLTYTVKDLAGNTLGTGIGVAFARQLGHVTAASNGYLDYDATGMKQITLHDEVIDGTECPTS